MQKVCPRPFMVVEFSSWGVAYPCCCSWLDTSYGNYMNNTFEDVWNSTQAQELRNRVLVGDYSLCKGRSFCASAIPLVPREEYMQAQMQVSPTIVGYSQDDTCNIACETCRCHLSKPDAAVQDSLDARIDDLFLPMSQNATNVTFSGNGDPFASPHYRKLIKKISSNNKQINFNLLTNGLLLNKQNCAEMGLLDANVVHINISIDAATPDTYRKIRRGSNFEQVFKNIAWAKEHYKKAHIVSIFTCTSRNYVELAEFCKLCKKNGIFPELNPVTARESFMTKTGFDKYAIHQPTHPLHEHFLQVMRTPQAIGLHDYGLRSFTRSSDVATRKSRFDYFSNWEKNDVDFEYFLQYIFHFCVQQGDTVIDVGANHALHTIPLGKLVGNKGRVFAFEAIPQNATMVKEKTQGLRVTVIQAAVTNEQLHAAFPTISFNHIVNNDGYSGILPAEHLPEGAVEETITVASTTLDISVPERYAVSFIKIDVEGGELHVLEGAERILRTSKPIIAFENGRRSSASQYGYSREHFFSFFRDRGYRLFCLTGEEFTESYWDEPNMLWEFLAVHEDSPHIQFFSNNLFSLANLHVQRQMRHLPSPVELTNQNNVAVTSATQIARPRLYLHIGMPGLDCSAYMQQAMYQNRDYLQSQGIYYPPFGGGQHPIAPWDSEGGLLQCVEAWQASGCPVGVFSHQSLVWAEPELYAHLSNIADVCIVFHLPSPLEWIEAHQRYVTEGSREWFTGERFWSHLRRDIDTDALGIWQWVKQWRCAYPTRQMFVQKLDGQTSSKDILYSFLQKIGKDDGIYGLDLADVHPCLVLGLPYLHFLAHTHFLPLAQNVRVSLRQQLHVLHCTAPLEDPRRVITHTALEPVTELLEQLHEEWNALLGEQRFSFDGLRRFLATEYYPHEQLPSELQQQIFKMLDSSLQQALIKSIGNACFENGGILLDIPAENILRERLRLWSLECTPPPPPSMLNYKQNKIVT